MGLLYCFFLVIAGLVNFNSFGDSVLILFCDLLDLDFSLSFDFDLDFDPLLFCFVVGGEPSGLEVISTFSGLDVFSGLGIFSGVLTVSELGFLLVLEGGSEGHQSNHFGQGSNWEMMDWPLPALVVETSLNEVRSTSPSLLKSVFSFPLIERVHIHIILNSY